MQWPAQRCDLRWTALWSGFGAPWSVLWSEALDAASAGKRVLAGVRGLPALARRKAGVEPLLPREVDDKLVPPAWRKEVYANPELPQGAVDRDTYVVCVLEQLHQALNNRDVFAAPSHRWSNPRARL